MAALGNKHTSQDMFLKSDMAIIQEIEPKTSLKI